MNNLTKVQQYLTRLRASIVDLSPRGAWRAVLISGTICFLSVTTLSVLLYFHVTQQADNASTEVHAPPKLDKKDLNAALKRIEEDNAVYKDLIK